MAKAKHKRSSKSKAKPRAKRRSSKNTTFWRRFLGFLAIPLVRRLVLIAVVVGLLYLWGAVIWEATLSLFGYGLIIIAIAVGVIIWVVWRGRFSSVAKHWNWAVGGISLALAVWGILSFFSV